MIKKNIVTIINENNYKDIGDISCKAIIIIPLAPSVASKTSIDKLRKILKTLFTRPKLVNKKNELKILKHIGLQDVTRSFYVLDNNNIIHLIHDEFNYDLYNINDDYQNKIIEDYIVNITNKFNLKNMKLTHLYFHYKMKI